MSHVSLRAFLRVASLMCLFIGSLSQLCGQEAASSLWLTHLSYQNTTLVAETKEKVYAVSEGALYSLTKGQTTEMQLYDRSTGLSGLDITHIAYSPESQALVVYYLSGGIDILTDDGEITNISAISMSDRLPDKTLHRILFAGHRAYFIGAFGISVVDLYDHLVVSTYFQGLDVIDATLPNTGEIWALVDGKLMSGNESDNLQDPSNWVEQAVGVAELNDLKEVRELAMIGSKLAVLKSDGMLLLLSSDLQTAEVVANPERGERVDKLFVSKQAVFANAQGYSYICQEGTGSFERSATGWTSMLSANSSRDVAWAAVWDRGVVRIDLKNLSTPTITELDFNRNSPLDNRYFAAVATHGRYYGVSGSRTVDRQWIPFTLKMFDGRRWENISGKDLADLGAGMVHDAISVAVDPDDADHIFVSTWGEGLFELRYPSTLVTHFKGHNSPLEQAIPDPNERYYRTGSLHFDAKGNLWMAQAGVVGGTIKMLDKQGKWHSFSFPSIGADNSYTQQVSYPNGVHWLGINHEKPGLYVFSDGNTPNDQSDDRSLYLASLREHSGREIPFRKFYALTIDHTGVLWLGSERGICSVSGADRIFDRNLAAVRPVGGEEPNLYYILDDVKINDIAVDKHNNKWIATDGDGLYLMNPSCTEILEHFTTANSPILSNSIVTADIDESNGIVYIGTIYGLQSYEAGTKEVEGKKIKGLSAYPNPLRPEMPDGITIKGVPAGSIVKIVNTQGHLVYETKSATSEVQWSARRGDGDRVSSGVYTVLVYDPSSKASGLLKIAVVK